MFLAGLNREIALVVKSRDPDSLEDAVQLALNEEREIKSLREISKYQTINNSNARHCFNCNRSGHTTQNCRNRPPNLPRNNYDNNFENSSRQYQNPNFRNQSTFQRPQQTQQPQNQYVRQVQPTNKFCNYCKKTGHVIQECRKRQYNNSKRGNNPSSTPSQNRQSNFLDNRNNAPLNS